MSHLDDAIEAGPPPADADAKAPRPIGVPPGYVAPGQRVPVPRQRTFGPSRYQTPPVEPRYHEGHDYLPATLSVEDRAALQRAMLAAGVYDRNDRVRIGLWDDTSRQAYRRVLELANASGMDVGGALNAWARMPPAEDTVMRKPLTVRVANPADLRQVMRTASRRTMGRYASDEETEAFVSAFQAAQAQAQRAEYALDETGGVVTAPPDPATFAEQRIRELYPAEAFAADLADTGAEFFDLLDSIGGG
ncbi:MAG: hypothetical protein M3Q48_14735 [Actinomycetota bacterium]|nr:hypothetical protein [Actinomycetota bacterium]